MAILLRMPEVAANATHATLVAWTKKEGETIAVGDCLAEIETEKAIVELNADSAGVMGRQLVAGGKEVEIGAVIGVLLASGESCVDMDALVASASSAAQAPAAPESVADGAPATNIPAPVATGADTSRIFASPLARRLASHRGLELAAINGSGPNGRIVKRDVDAASEASVAVPLKPEVQPVAEASQNGFVEVPHSGMRKTIARRLSESKATIPHFYLTVDCRMDRLLTLRTEINTGAPRKISVNDFIVRAVAVALKEVPDANVGWTESAMRHYKQADISVAVSTDGGLITPIVRAADSKPLSVISAEMADLAARARSGQLKPQEYQGGSFSISNLGMFGVTEFNAIINPPQAAILAVGATQAQAVIVDGTVTVAQVMRCTLSVDHRAIDGALAAQWLAAYKRLMENPLSMLV